MMTSQRLQSVIFCLFSRCRITRHNKTNKRLCLATHGSSLLQTGV